MPAHTQTRWRKKQTVWIAVGLIGVWSLGQARPLWGAEAPQGRSQAPGLVRAWSSQVQMDPGRSRVQHLCLYEDTLLVQTNRAILHAFDAETGGTQWSLMVGSPDRPSLPPDLNEQFAAVVNGSTLFVLNRIDGKILWKTPLMGLPGAGPSLGHMRVYVPMLQGLVYVYGLEPAKDPRDALGELRLPRPKSRRETPEERRARMAEFRIAQEKVRPAACQSFGHTMVPVRVGRPDPLVEIVAWPSHVGDLFIGIFDSREEKFTIRHRLPTQRPISAPAAYLPAPRERPGEGGLFFTANHDGYVWAIREKNGDVLWRFATGRVVQTVPVVIDAQLFVVTLDGDLYCISAQTGQQQWHVTGFLQFVAASKQCVYVVDRLQRLQVLDRKTGIQLDALAASGQMFLTNTENDRIYMASPNGRIQCLREPELNEPVFHSTARSGKAQAATPVIQQEALPMEKEKPQPAPSPEEKTTPFQEPFPEPAEQKEAPPQEKEANQLFSARLWPFRDQTGLAMS